MTSEIDLLKAKAFHKFVHITGYCLLVVTRRWTRRFAEAAHIRRDDGVILSECVEKRNPHVRGIAEAVNQYERLLPGSCLQVVNFDGAQVRSMRFIVAALGQYRHHETEKEKYDELLHFPWPLPTYVVPVGP